MINDDTIFPEDIIIETNVSIGPRVVFAGENIVIGSGARLDAACVIDKHVSVGRGAWVRAGAVVLRSVPANAIAEGNPARVVGYINGSPENRPEPRHIDTISLDHLERPAQVSLGVGSSALYLMRRVIDSRGTLTVGEVPGEVPFTPARYFSVFDVPSIELRGEHAHKKCQQFLICMNGSCRILLDDGMQRCEVTLDSPDIGVFMPQMIWGTQYRYSHDAVLLVFASRPYENDDYIRSYEEFLQEIERQNS